MNNNQNANSEYEKLIVALRSIDQPGFDAEKKEILKSRIVAQTKVSLLMEILRKLSESIVLSGDRRAIVKERIFAIIDDRAQRAFAWRWPKRLISGVMAFVLFFTLFPFIDTGSNVVSAGTFTKVDYVDGDVMVQRGGRLLTAVEGMEIREGDRIVTGKSGLVTVEYVDNSITRLKGNTEVVVNHLLYDANNEARTYVEVAVLEGTVWSKVINLVDKKAAFVVKTKEIYAAATRAAFNVEVDDSDVEIEVFNHSVHVHEPKVKKKSKVPLGKKVKTRVGTGKIEVIDMDEEKLRDEWIVTNLVEDKQYVNKIERKLLAQKSEKLGVSESGDVKLHNSLKDEALLLLSFDDIDDRKIKLDIAEKKFIAASLKLNEVNLSEEDKLEAQANVNAFADEVKSFYRLIAEVSKGDELFANDLQAYVEDKILKHKKDLSIKLPDSPDYLAKKVISEVELLAVKDDKDLAALKYTQANEKLVEAEEIIAKGDEELGLETVKQYGDEVEQIMKIIGSLDIKDVALKEEIVTEVEDDLAVLMGMNAPTETIEKLSEGINDARQSINQEILSKDSGSNEVESVEAQIDSTQSGDFINSSTTTSSTSTITTSP